MHLSPGVYPYYLEIHDREAVTSGIKPTYPFLDRRLVEFCLALPANQKLGGGWPRWVYRRATADLLPHDVCWRTEKSNLNPVLMHAMLVHDRKRIGEMLIEATKVIEPYVDATVLRTAWERSLSAGYRGTSSLWAMPDLLRVWRAVTLSRWLQQTGFGR